MRARTNVSGLLLIVCVCLFFVLPGCRHNVSMIQGQQWLDTKKESAGTNITGKWYSQEWGESVLKQTDREVIGTIGDHYAKGVVSGNTLYLTMYMLGNEIVNYFADLKLQSDGSFKGYYTKYEIITDEIINDYNQNTNKMGEKASKALLRPMSLARQPASP